MITHFLGQSAVVTCSTSERTYQSKFTSTAHETSQLIRTLNFRLAFWLKLICGFVLDVTKKLNDDLHHLIQARLKLVQEFSKQRKLNPALLFIGCKLDEREIREFSYADGKHLAEKHGAMYTEMSGATGLFVVRGLNNALRAAIGNREQRLLFANVAMS